MFPAKMLILHYGTKNLHTPEDFLKIIINIS